MATRGGRRTISGKRKFEDAEANCIMDAEEWPYRKRLFYSFYKFELDYFAKLLPDMTSDGAWLGIEDRDVDSIWQTR